MLFTYIGSLRDICSLPCQKHHRVKKHELKDEDGFPDRRVPCNSQNVGKIAAGLAAGSNIHAKIDELLSDEDLHHLDKLHNFLTVLMCSPGVVVPSRWMFTVWCDEGAEFGPLDLERPL